MAVAMSQLSLDGFAPTRHGAQRPRGGERPARTVLRHSRALPSLLAPLRQVDVRWDERAGTLWTFMCPQGRPSFNPGLLEDLQAVQDGMKEMFAGREHALRYLVLGSRFPGVFCLGGDLGLFVEKIRDGDRQGLIDYGRACVRVLHRNITGVELPIITIGLVQGDALGGGFETVLSFHVVVAERGVKFGLPETLFGLFPGMGALSLLSRRLGTARAEEMIMSGRNYTAEELHEMGLVQVLAKPGEGEAAVRAYIERTERRHGGLTGMYRASRQINPVSLAELERIVEIWADAALDLPEPNLKMMQRLASAQDRLDGSVPRIAAE
jgi:DSF synthase